MKKMKLALIILIAVNSTAAFAEDIEYDMICKDKAATYAKAVARVQFSKVEVSDIRLVRNGFAEDPESNIQIWSVDVTSKGMFASATIVHTHLAGVDCSVTKIIPNALD